MDLVPSTCVLLLVIPGYSAHENKPPIWRNESIGVECFVEFKLDLVEKPTRYHKEATMSSHHSQAPVLTIGMHQWVELECSCCCEQDKVKRIAARVASQRNIQGENESSYTEPVEPPGQIQFQIISTNGHVALLTENKRTVVNVRSHHTSGDGDDAHSDNCDESGSCTEMYKPVDCIQVDKNSTSGKSTQGFYVYGDNIGHSEVKAALIWMDNPQKASNEGENKEDKAKMQSTKPSTQTTTNKRMRLLITDAQVFVTRQQLIADGRLNSEEENMEQYNETVGGRWEKSIRVTILLRPQKFYMASDWSAAIIAFLFAISVGCCNDPTLCRSQLRQSKAILAAVCCQLVIVPVLTLGLGACFALSVDQAFGLFVTSTVPGGGMAYLLTYLTNGNRQLSAALSLVVSWIDIITAPLWINTIGWYWFNRPIHIWKAIGWLSIIAMAQTLGTMIRGCHPGLASAILTWITRPLLLLSGILMVTLGVYINHYAFTEINPNLILSLLFVITLGFLTGWVSGRILRQNLPVTKTLANEAAVFNGLLCMPLLRTCVHAPEGDLAAVPPLWITFMTPIPLVYHAVLSVVNRWLVEYLKRRRKNAEQKEANTILATAPGAEASEIGATSVAAVAAAAIAVAPTITAGERTSKDNRWIVSSDGYANEIETNMDKPYPVMNTRYVTANGCGMEKEQITREKQMERIALKQAADKQQTDEQAENVRLLELASKSEFIRGKPLEEVGSLRSRKIALDVKSASRWLSETAEGMDQLKNKNTTGTQSIENSRNMAPTLLEREHLMRKHHQQQPASRHELPKQNVISRKEIHKPITYTNL